MCHVIEKENEKTPDRKSIRENSYLVIAIPREDRKKERLRKTAFFPSSSGRNWSVMIFAFALIYGEWEYSSGTIVLAWCACRWRCYSIDLTRTWPDLALAPGSGIGFTRWLCRVEDNPAIVGSLVSGRCRPRSLSCLFPSLYATTILSRL